MLTLDYFKTHPLRVPKDQSALTIGQLIQSELAATAPVEDIHPTAGAFIHYGGVELADMLTICKPNMPPQDLSVLSGLWYNSCGVVAKHLLFYVWRIITKEMRHGSVEKCNKAFGSDPKWNPEAVALCKQISGGGGGYEQLLIAHPNLNALAYVDCVEQQFRKGGWGGAFGGPKWADIALVFQRYLRGETSAMIAADRAWTLVHNTGPIFNKGFYFEHHDSRLIAVLNAQATSSVFSLGTDFLSKHSGYAHETSSSFNLFVKMAVTAIQTVKPDYQPGAGGAVNSDGSKGALPTLKGGGKVTSFGPVHFTPGTREEA